MVSNWTSMMVDIVLLTFLATYAFIRLSSLWKGGD